MTHPWHPEVSWPNLVADDTVSDDTYHNYIPNNLSLPLLQRWWKRDRCVAICLRFENVSILGQRTYLRCLYGLLCCDCIASCTVYPKKYAHGFCFAVLCCGYTLTDFPISIRLTSLALWQSNDCPSASKATLMNMDKYFMWIHYERLHNHNKAKHNKTVCIFLGIYCTWNSEFLVFFSVASLRLGGLYSNEVIMNRVHNPCCVPVGLELFYSHTLSPISGFKLVDATMSHTMINNGQNSSTIC